jgi:soluble lytic murein transglycosylase-like protein
MWLRLAACFGVLWLVPSARADVYSFIDSDGVAHYSNVPTDPHYGLLLSTPSSERTTSPPRKTVANAAQYDSIIERAAHGTGLSAALLRAVISVESAFDPQAISARGAKGLMQLEPHTAAHYGAVDVFDPSQNIDAGARYLRDLLDHYGGQLELALAAYNAGEVAVERYQGHIPSFAETRRYVPAVMRLYKSLLARTQSTLPGPDRPGR